MSMATLDWRQRYPDRWDRELQALDATRWGYTVVEHHGRWGPCLHIDYPVTASTPRAPTVRLEVSFPVEYPFFAPLVHDPDNGLGLLRHRNSDGLLCLIEDDDWDLETMLVDLLDTQIPILTLAGRSPTRPAAGLEVPLAEPIARMTPQVWDRALIMPDQAPPDNVTEGALTARFTLGSRGPQAMTVEYLFADQVRIANPAHTVVSALPYRCYGRWARDPDFNLNDTPAQTFQRLNTSLAPLQVDLSPPPSGQQPNAAHGGEARQDQCSELAESRRASTVSGEAGPDVMELLCVQVPGEGNYRQPGNQWVAIVHLADDGLHRYRYLQVQQFGHQALAVRTPQTRPLSQRRVIVIGLGSVGSHVVEDLARTGVGRLDLVDFDSVDVATATRQYAPVYVAGQFKACVVTARTNQLPHVQAHAHVIHVGGNPGYAGPARPAFEIALARADLVIDATASPAVSRYLAATCQHRHQDFLHVSSTAGAWGGCVYLTTPGHGCWSCLQHHRLDHQVSTPPADPDGWVVPSGCASPTFTGTNADLATIAHHASRVAIDRLLDGPGLGGDLYVATLSKPTRAGAARPVPARWKTIGLPIHPACPLHATTASAGT